MRKLLFVVLLSVLCMIVPAAHAQAAHNCVLSWTPSTDGASNPSSGYNILKGTTSGGESTTPVNSSPVAVGCTSTTTCTWTDSNVQAGQTIYYKVVFVVGTQSSAPSAEGSGTVPINPPTGLSVVTN